ncbi:hypothetical protein [Agromyces sp. NPDC058064]|uniref:hypothetical protein n=1 Tax=Agromyces sp. NPDC058064 TaxID=3346322 RepID=UPI0036DA29EF
MTDENTSPGEAVLPAAAIQSIATNTVSRFLEEGGTPLAALQAVDRALNAVPQSQRADLFGQIIGRLSVAFTLILAMHPSSRELIEKVRERMLFDDVARRFDAQA